MKRVLLILLTTLTITNAGFFQEEDKQKHIAYSVPFGMIGGLTCRGDRGFDLRGWEAIACGTAIGMIPGIFKEASDQATYGGWDNRDLMADAIGAFLGSVGTITLFRFNSGSW
jgi:VanZ family protein